MGSHIFGILGVRKNITVIIREDFYYIMCNKCANSFRDDLVKRLYKVDA